MGAVILALYLVLSREGVVTMGEPMTQNQTIKTFQQDLDLHLSKEIEVFEHLAGHELLPHERKLAQAFFGLGCVHAAKGVFSAQKE